MSKFGLLLAAMAGVIGNAIPNPALLRDLLPGLPEVRPPRLKNRSRYMPLQGEKEMARRRRQMGLE